MKKNKKQQETEDIRTDTPRFNEAEDATQAPAAQSPENPVEPKGKKGAKANAAKKDGNTAEEPSGGKKQTATSSVRDLGPMEIYTVAKPVAALKTALVLNELQDYKTELVSVPVKIVTEQIFFGFRTILDRIDETKGMSVSDEVLMNICQTLLRYHNTLGLTAWTGSEDGARGGQVAPKSVDGFPVTEMKNNRLEIPAEAYVVDNVNQNGGGASLIYTPELKEVREMLEATGLPQAAINGVIKAAITNLDRFFIRNVFTPAALRSAMEKDIISAGDLESLGSFTFDEIVDALRNAQAVYASICKIKTLDSFGEALVKQVTTGKMLATTFNLLKAFHEWDGPTAPVEMEVVLRNMSQQFSFEPALKVNFSANGLIGDVVGVANDFLVDIERSDLIAFLFYLMKQFGDFPIATASDEITAIYARLAEAEMQGVERYAYKANPLVFSHGDRATLRKYYVQRGTDRAAASAQQAQDQLKQLFLRMFVRRYLEMIVKGESGTLASRLTALIDQRALSRNESWDYLVQRAIQVQSIVFQSFIDTFAKLHDLALSREVYFERDTRRTRDVLISYFTESIQYYKTSTLAADHPAAVKDVALLFSSSFAKFDFDVARLFYTAKDSMKNGYQNMVYDPVQDNYMQYYLTMPQEGNILDAPQVVPTTVLLNDLTKALDIDYAIIEPFRGIFYSTDAGRALLAHPPVKDLLASDHFSYFETQYGTWKFYTKPEEIAREYHYPLAMAKRIFDAAPAIEMAGKKKLALAFAYSGPAQKTLFMKRDLLPVYEILDPDEYYKPKFRVNWPYAAKIQIKGFKQPLTEILKFSPVANADFIEAIKDADSWKSKSGQWQESAAADGRQKTSDQFAERPDLDNEAIPEPKGE